MLRPLREAGLRTRHCDSKEHSEESLGHNNPRLRKRVPARKTPLPDTTYERKKLRTKKPTLAGRSARRRMK